MSQQAATGVVGEHSFQKLFSPIKIGDLRLKNRLLMPPMIERLAKQGMVNKAVTEFYAARARGGVGLIVLTPGIIDVSMASDIQLGIYEDRFVPSLKEFTDAIHACGAAIGIELMHLGRQGGEIPGYRPVAPSPIPWSPQEEVPRELTTAEVDDLVEKFADGARRAREAGFDMVELHACHGYLLSGFLSPHTNKRTDKYGGDVAGRAKVMVDIVKLIKQRVGNDFPVSCRINGSDNIPGGVTVDLAIQTARLLEEVGSDLISISAGAYGSYPVIVPPYDQALGCNAHLSEKIKQAVKVPVAVAGRLSDPEAAEQVLQEGKTDLIAVARGLLADPDLPNKAMRGETRAIRGCISCNVCIDSEPTLPICCTLNPEAGREAEMAIRAAAIRKRVLVAGAGLAGLEAARVAALRGHTVDLYEETDHVGGQWVLAGTPPHKERHKAVLDYYRYELDRAGVQLHLGSRVTEKVLGDDLPDAVILAHGATPIVPPIPGVDLPFVVTAWDVLRGLPVGGRVLVIGGGMTGLETAEVLWGQGKDVVVVEMLPRAGADLGGTVRWHFMQRLKKTKITVHTKTQVQRIGEGGTVVVRRDGQEESWQGLENVVLACGARPRNSLKDAAARVSGEVYLIGDAARVRKGIDAIREGAETGRRI